MKFDLPDRNINVFSVLYREESIQQYFLNDIIKIIKESESYNYTGLLLFESNRGNIDPWVFAQTVLHSSESLSPFIAVNPVYMHPFAVAKKILTLGSFYGRKVFLNFITGTSKSDLNSLNDQVEHDERYIRLKEYIHIVDHLLSNQKPLTFNGKFYTVSNLQLSSKLSLELLPVFYVAGASSSAAEVRKMLGTSSMSMAGSVDDFQTDALMEDKKLGVHFGIVTRPDRQSAEKRMEELFEESCEGKELLDLSLTNTDGLWKKNLKALSLKPKSPDSTFCLRSFRNFKSDCPYHVGSYNDVAEVLLKYVMNGYTTIVIEIPSGNDEFKYISEAFRIAKDLIMQKCYRTINFEFSF